MILGDRSDHMETRLKQIATGKLVAFYNHLISTIKNILIEEMQYDYKSFQEIINLYLCSKFPGPLHLARKIVSLDRVR